jgi:hypothetical protein
MNETIRREADRFMEVSFVRVISGYFYYNIKCRGGEEEKGRRGEREKGRVLGVGEVLAVPPMAGSPGVTCMRSIKHCRRDFRSRIVYKFLEGR